MLSREDAIATITSATENNANTKPNAFMSAAIDPIALMKLLMKPWDLYLNLKNYRDCKL